MDALSQLSYGPGKPTDFFAETREERLPYCDLSRLSRIFSLECNWKAPQSVCLGVFVGLARPEKRWAWVTSVVGYLSVFAFVALFGWSMVLYPGGTWTNRQTTSYRFFENFFCDSTHSHGLNGLRNAGAVFAKAALVSITPALGLFFFCLARVRPEALWTARFIRGCGVLSALCLVFVPLTPSDTFATLHAVFALAASAAGLAGLLGYLVVVRNNGRAAVPGIVLLVLVAVDVLMYVQQVQTHGPTPPALPALQKVAAGWLLGWMLVLFRKR